MRPFFQVVLRTNDLPAARTFYSAVLGAEPDHLVQLHEQAVARGARPHWLGLLDVGDVDRAAARFTQRGASPLGPKWVNPEGVEAAVMRDPGGAVVALARPPSAPMPCLAPDVVWSVLNTYDVERAKASYAELLGWTYAAPVDLGSLGVFHPFASSPGGPLLGAMGDVAGRSGVHPHWLFHFRVSVLDVAVDAVRAGGGVELGRFILPSGERVAVCDDPQGAAFALREGGGGSAAGTQGSKGDLRGESSRP